ncbi:MAG: GNAT family N-acetyltransferase [Deltaproteobacteria bacterium]|nr:GNAT family N-acetyltransferase [Deltaproteobacteria bacterium]
MSDAPTVRRVRREDAPALAAIAWSIVTAYGLPRDPDLLEYGKPRRGVYAELCAEVDGELVGTITLSQHPHDRSAGWVSKFFVDPLARGRGAGKALHAALLIEAHRAGMTWLELSTLTVFHEAIALYEAHGWKRRRSTHGMERRYFLRLVD